MRQALGEFGRQFGVTAFTLDDGTILAEVPMPQAELAPFTGHGDTVSRGDLVRVWCTFGHTPETLEHEDVRVNDYGDDWMNILRPGGAISSFALGKQSGGGFSRRLELVEATPGSSGSVA